MNHAGVRQPRLVAGALLFAVAGYILLWMSLKPVVFTRSHADFACFYRAGRMVIAGDGGHIYELAAERQYDARLGTGVLDAEGHRLSLLFVFPPYMLAAFAPLAHLKYADAELAWYVTNIGLLLALLWVLRRQLGCDDKVIALAVVAPVLFLPAMLALIQGQPSILLLLLFTLAYADFLHGRDMRAGCWLALAAFKPQLVLPMVLAIVVWRRWKALRGFFSASLALAGISVAIVGWRGLIAYPHALLQFGQLDPSLGGEHPASMPNLRGFLSVVAGSHTSALALGSGAAAVSLLLVAVVLLLLNRRHEVSAASFSLVVAVTVLVSHHAYLHDATVLLLPLFLIGQMMSSAVRTPLHIALAAVAVVMFLLLFAPGSLITTAVLMFAATVTLAALLGIEAYPVTGSGMKLA